MKSLRSARNRIVAILILPALLLGLFFLPPSRLEVLDPASPIQWCRHEFGTNLTFSFFNGRPMNSHRLARLLERFNPLFRRNLKVEWYKAEVHEMQVEEPMLMVCVGFSRNPDDVDPGFGAVLVGPAGERTPLTDLGSEVLGTQPIAVFYLEEPPASIEGLEVRAGASGHMKSMRCYGTETLWTVPSRLRR